MVCSCLYSFLLTKISEETKRAVGDKSKPIGWKREKRAKMRTFFESIAKANNLNPLLPESWYSITQSYVKSFKVKIKIKIKININIKIT
jgi:hypothetical protein